MHNYSDCIVASILAIYNLHHVYICMLFLQRHCDVKVSETQLTANLFDFTVCTLKGYSARNTYHTTHVVIGSFEGVLFFTQLILSLLSSKEK